MNKLLTILLLLAVVGIAPVSAEVLIYQFRSVSKGVGGGIEFSSTGCGYLVWNLDDDHFTWIESATGNGQKRYRVVDGSPLVVTATGRGDRRFVTFSGAGSENGRYFQDYNRGALVTLKIATGRTASWPRTMKGMLHSIDTVTGPRLYDATRTYVYLAKRTIAANDATQTEDGVIAGLRAELENAGYLDVAEASASQSQTEHGAIMESSVTILSGGVIRPPPPQPNTPLDPLDPRLPGTPIGP